MKRKKLAVMSQNDLHVFTTTLLERMTDAYESDAVARDEGRPGLEKMKLLAEVVDGMGKKESCSVLLENGILSHVNAWIMPVKKKVGAKEESKREERSATKEQCHMNNDSLADRFARGCRFLSRR